MKNLLLPITCLTLAVSSQAHGLNGCDAILQQGIYDINNTLSDTQKHTIAKNSLCKSDERKRGGGFGFSIPKIFKANGKGGKSDIDKFCDSDFKDIKADKNYVSINKQINSVIVNAWSKCAESSKGRVSQYIQPSLDPSRFIYGIIFTPDPEVGVNKVKINEWNISGGTCAQNYINKTLNHNRKTMICDRDPNDVVIITAESSEFGSNLKHVQLPAYKETKPTSYFVNVDTGDHEHAGTDAGDFFITLSGTIGEETFLLDNADVDDRRVASTDSYTFKASEDLGDISQLVIRSNARGAGKDGWLFKKAVVRNQSGDKVWIFPCGQRGKWIDADDGHPLQRTMTINGNCW